jgi:hypothetical protein
MDKVVNTVGQYIAPPKLNVINKLLAEAEHIPGDDDTSPLGQFKRRLMEFLDESLHPDREELRMRSRSWRDKETGRSWFKWGDIDDWYRRRKYFDLKHSDALNYVRQLDGDTGVVNLGERYGVQRAWWVPLDPRERTPEPDGVKLPDPGDGLGHETEAAQRKALGKRHPTKVGR